MSTLNASRVRLRRVNSSTRAEEIVTEEEKQRRAQPDRPIHKPKDSLFSWTSGFQHYEGIMNWAFLLLTLGGVRLALENFNKYGLRVDPTFWVLAVIGDVTGDPITGDILIVPILIYANVIVLFTLFLEKALAKEWIPTTVGFVFHCLNILSLLVVPIVLINIKHSGPVKGTITCGLYSILFLKLWSYVQVNHWCRNHRRLNERKIANRSHTMTDFPKELLPDTDQMNTGRRRSGVEAIVQYPDNLNIPDIYYFWFAPTLCYELNFPKMQRTRKTFLSRRAVEVILGTNIVLGLIQQWIFPSVVNSLLPFSNMEFTRALERLLKLSLPNHLIWLIFFYLVFHSFLNTLGELLRFADREFYQDWWNANNILTFWKTWNLPVHRWAVRHLFKPILRNGYSVYTAQLVVFLISAFLHEYLVSVPLRVFKIYAFMGMAMQLPLIFISKWMEDNLGPRAGNLCVWISLIIGQPLAIMMYYHDYVVEHHGEELLDFYGKMEPKHL